MGTTEKINIYVPENIGDMLEHDARMFEIFKSDGQTINRNRFLSMLLLGYYNSYVNECSEQRKKIMLELDGCLADNSLAYEVADNILKSVILPEVPSRKGKNPTRLSLKPTKETEGLILDMLSEIGADDFISQYFCRLLMSYCEKTFSTREQLVFKDNYEVLLSACENRKPITFTTIWNKQAIHKVIPYKMAVGKEEMFNYLLCAEMNDYTGKQEAKVYRLNRISKINNSRSTEQITDEVIEYLDKMLKYAPQYMINADEEICVKLSEAGKRSYNRIYYGRPEYERIEKKVDGDYYYFQCSRDQVFFYFRRFNPGHAEIISPESLRKEMIKFYEKSLEVYEEVKVNE